MRGAVRSTRASRAWRHRVRVRVTLAAALVGLACAVAGAVLFVAGLHENLEQSLLDSAQQQADAVQAQLDVGRSPAQAVLSGKRDVVIQVVGPSGELLASDHPGASVPARTAPGTTEGAHVTGLADPYAVWAQRTGDGRLVVVGLSEEQLRRATDTAVLLLTIAVPAGVLLLAVVVWLSVGRALRPVEVMRREAAAITRADAPRRLAVPPGDDEIPLLAATLNAMLERIDRSQRRQRQFVSDASHELRSPLAVIRQMVEVAQRRPASTTVPRLAEEVGAEEARMESLVTALLTLARLDDGAPPAAQTVDLDDAVLLEVDRLRAADAGLLVDRTAVSAAQTYGDPVLLGQVVANLLGNAARHAAARVVVALHEADGVAVLTVDDDGDGVPVADRQRIFDRFARLDQARTRDAGGAGLGLAIVREVVRASGGTVAVGDSALGGARFTVTLPVPAGRGSTAPAAR